jgi:formylmethanofuran dehydrogenase subunit C
VTLTLTLREQPDVPLEAEVLTPDRLTGDIAALPLWHGKERTRVGEFFEVSGSGDDVRLDGDLSRVRYVGAEMTAGRLTVAGDVGAHVGAGMRGGELHVEGDAGDHAGAGMRGGTLVVRGSAGRKLGSERMRGGEIVVHGDAGAQAGAGLRRGLIAVGGRVGEAAGLRMLAGTIVAVGGVGPWAGAGMRRGSIVTTEAAPLSTFTFSCTYRPPFLRLYLRRLRALGLPVSDEQIDGRYARWCGDGLELRRGEILILEDA